MQEQEKKEEHGHDENKLVAEPIRNPQFARELRCRRQPQTGGRR